ncbi:MAG: flagellin [Maricaulaceae bacterium]
MALNSINTNPGAFIALQNLNSVNADLATTSNRIATGLEVASAADNGAVFAIAQAQRAEVSGLGVAQDSLSRVGSTLDVALSAGEAVSDLLIELRDTALAGSDTSLDTASRAALNEDFTALRDQIQGLVDSAEFNGVNLLNGTQTGGLDAIANADGTQTINVAEQNLNLGSGVVTITAGATFTTPTEAGDLVTLLDASIDNVNTSLANLGTSSRILDIQSTFVSDLSDTLEVGIGNLVDADLAEESANLTALQTQQQLATSAFSIANSAPSALLGLF